MSRYTNVDEFLEKKAGGAKNVVTGKAGLLTGTIGDVGKLWKGLGKPGKAGVIAGGLGLLGAGALGLGGLLSGDRPGDTLSYRVNKGLHGLLDRIRADEAVGESFAKALGSSSADKLMGLTSDIVTKGYESLKDTLVTSPTRKLIFNALKKEDEILRATPNKDLLESYHTMTKVAPTLSTDKNAVKSFLRVAATTPGGVDFMTVKNLAEAEKAVSQAKSYKK